MLQKAKCSVGLHRRTACCVRQAADGTFLSTCWRCDIPLLLVARRWKTIAAPKRKAHAGRIVVPVLDPAPDAPPFDGRGTAWTPAR